MAAQTGLFEVEQEGDTFIFTPTADLREFDYQRIETGTAALLDALERSAVRNVVVDFVGVVGGLLLT